MCMSCKSKRVKIYSFVENRMTGYPIKFDHNQVEQLRRKFKKISGNKQIINESTFHENMGILGLHSVHGFSDRLFNSFDIDNDGSISFQDFLEYMEVLKCGNEKNKAKISFRLIDIKNRNSVNIEEFKQFLSDYFCSWTSITNSVITPEVKQRTDQYVNYIFSKVKRDTKKDTIDFRYYAEKMYGDKDFMEAFEFITQGVANMFISDRLKQNDSLLLFKVLTKIKQISIAAGHKDDKFDYNHTAMDKIMKSSISKPRQSQLYQQHGEKPNIEQQNYPFERKQKKQSQYFFKKPRKNTVTKTNETFQTNKTYNHTYTTHTPAHTQQYIFRDDPQYVSHQSRRQQAHKCKSCYNLIVLEKKLEYLTGKMQQLIDETKVIYDRLYTQFITNSNTNHKKETVRNIHQQSEISKDNMIFFGDDNWNLVLNMMIGIQMAVRSVRGYQEMIYEEPADFNLKYYFQLVPRRFGGQKYFSRICSFTDYAPNTFNHIRKIFNIDNEEYINSIGPNKLMTSLMMGEVNSLTALTSQGKSGSFFYYTADGKYMLKTIHYRQYRYLRSILEDYYEHIKNNPDTLITKFFGLHKLIEKDDTGEVIKKSYFAIMGNVFNTNEKIIERYDVKGSWYGRETKDQRPGITKKDNDFKNNMKGGIIVKPEDRQKLVSIIRKDAQFFRIHEIIDYSLLIGVIKRQAYDIESKYVLEQSEAALDENKDNILYESKAGNQAYIFGIIDILTEYNSRKVMEYYFKTLIYGEGISAVPPDDYAERFINFIERTVFPAEKKINN